MGRNVETKINSMTIGEMIIPRKLPNLFHNLFGTTKILGKKNARKRKSNEIIIDQTIIGFEKKTGIMPTKKKTAEKTTPKFFSEEGTILK